MTLPTTFSVLDVLFITQQIEIFTRHLSSKNSPSRGTHLTIRTGLEAVQAPSVKEIPEEEASINNSAVVAFSPESFVLSGTNINTQELGVLPRMIFANNVVKRLIQRSLPIRSTSKLQNNDHRDNIRYVIMSPEICEKANVDGIELNALMDTDS
ncbi:hypothetical protein CEXT_288261 [Caerostris extrusa]|uniref:Uncharacterized protein n=1 Tax=Caerostris extrusa TaxID=172846 RepID=A0AAV4MSG9_CAEEX|nr:hypothetical protein CEXT_288261 [Caerostris extrusa]